LQKIETNIWQGVNATNGEFDGFQALLAADGDVIDVVGTSVMLPMSFTELGAVVDAIPLPFTARKT
jgi:hypothetical protein